MPPPSASAARFAAHWVVDALAGDETLDFSVIKALVGVWPESLAGAPGATRERFALRCLQEVAEGAALAGGEMIRVDATRSCEEFLLELIGQVGSLGSLEMDMLPPFSDIQNFIHINIPTLAETSFELLREVSPEIASMVPPSPVEKSGKNNVDDQSFCSTSRDHVNTEKHGFPRDSCDLQRVNLKVFLNGIDTRGLQKDSMEPIPELNEPSTLSIRLSDQPQENTVDDRDMSITAEPASATCSDALLRSNTELLSKKDAVETTVLPEFVAADDTAMIAQPLGRKTRNSLQHDRGEKTSQDLDDGSARIQLVEKDPGHNEPNLEASSADKANQALQDDGDILKKNTFCAGQIAIDSPCCNVTSHNKSEKNTGKNMSDRYVPNSPQDGNKGAKRAASKKLMENAVAETSNVHCSDDNSSGFAAACLLSSIGNMLSSTQDRDDNGSIEDLTEHDLCIKCGKDGQLQKCSGCSLTAHDRCFGSTVTLDVSGQLCCPVCFYTKASEAYQKAKTAYLEARKNLSAFLGTKQFAKQYDEQSTGKQPAATSSKYHLNEGNTSKKQGNNQSEAENLSHKDEEPGQWRKKQRTNDTSDACPEEDQLNGCNTSKRQDNDQSEEDNLSHKDEEPGQQRKKQRKNYTNDVCPEEDQLNGCNTSIRQGNHQYGNLPHKDLEPGQHKTNATTDTRTTDIATNKDCALDYKRRHVHVAEHGQPVENANAREDGNCNSFCEAQHSSQNRYSPVTSQNVEADKHDGRTNSGECENSDEIEATSSNDSGKQSSPPWRNMRHHKARLQQKQTVVSNNLKKALGRQDEHMPSPSKKRNYAPKRYSNPLAPAGRRSKLSWTEVEEQTLRDAMLKFTPVDDGLIPWVRILDYGRDVFHKTRLPSDLRVKWRNMKNKS